MVSEADFVVDLCCGSGSGCVAALRMGYNAYGVDRSTKQLQEAKRRLNMFMMGEADQIKHDREVREGVEATTDVKTAATAKAAAEMPQLIDDDIMP